MNKESFSLQSTLEANFLNVILPENPEIDEIAEKVIREDRPDFLIAYRDVNINGNITLKYKLINTIALAYSDRNMTKDQFIVLYMSLLNPFIQGKDWFLDYHNFCIDERYIFLDKQTMKASYIYVPEASFQNQDEDIVQFFKKIFSQIKIVNDPAFQVTMYQYFISDHVNFTDLYQLLQKEMKADMKTAEIRMPKVPEKPEIKNTGTKSMQPLAEQNVHVKAVEAKAEQQVENSPFDIFDTGKKKTNSGDSAINALFGGKDKKKDDKSGKADKKNTGFNLFGKRKNKKDINDTKEEQLVERQKNAEMQNVYDNAFESDKTETPQQCSDITETEDEGNNFAVNAYLELLHSEIPGAIERINLNFAGPYITIGRMSSDETKPDVCFNKEFTRIGRKHARIERAGNGYCIIDLGSANHTLLNGNTLIPNQPYPLENNAILEFTKSKPVKYRVVILS